jgi:hypothetical protein
VVHCLKTVCEGGVCMGEACAPVFAVRDIRRERLPLGPGGHDSEEGDGRGGHVEGEWRPSGGWDPHRDRVGAEDRLAARSSRDLR